MFENKSIIERKKTIIVLGPPRSGTSMTAGILSNLGVNMGNIRQPDAQNPRGYFEDKDFLVLLDGIFEAAGSQFNGFNPPPLKAILLQRTHFDKKIKSLIEERSSNTKSQFWGWKSPTTSFTINLFLPYLTNPFFVVVLRNPLDIANSMVRYTISKHFLYNKLSLLEALKLTNLYYNQIFTFLEQHPDLPRIFVSFEGIVKKPQEHIKNLAEFIGIHLTSETLRKAIKSVTSNSGIKKSRFIMKIQNYTASQMLIYVMKCIRNPYKISQYIRDTLREL